MRRYRRRLLPISESRRRAGRSACRAHRCRHRLPPCPEAGHACVSRRRCRRASGPRRGSAATVISPETVESVLSTRLLETSIVALAGTCRSAMPAWPVLFAMIELLITCCVIAEQIPLAPVCETVHEAGLKWLGSKSFRTAWRCASGVRKPWQQPKIATRPLCDQRTLLGA